MFLTAQWPSSYILFVKKSLETWAKTWPGLVIPQRNPLLYNNGDKARRDVRAASLGSLCGLLSGEEISLYSPDMLPEITLLAQKHDVIHSVIEPYATIENTKIFSELQKLEGIGLVVPVEEEHMYYAAMNSKSCELTAVGKQYWRLVKEKRI